jgi:hypothetical protein
MLCLDSITLLPGTKPNELTRGIIKRITEHKHNDASKYYMKISKIVTDIDGNDNYLMMTMTITINFGKNSSTFTYNYVGKNNQYTYESDDLIDIISSEKITSISATISTPPKYKLNWWFSTIKIYEMKNSTVTGNIIDL